MPYFNYKDAAAPRFVPSGAAKFSFCSSYVRSGAKRDRAAAEQIPRPFHDSGLYIGSRANPMRTSGVKITPVNTHMTHSPGIGYLKIERIARISTYRSPTMAEAARKPRTP